MKRKVCFVALPLVATVLFSCGPAAISLERAKEVIDDIVDSYQIGFDSIYLKETETIVDLDGVKSVQYLENYVNVKEKYLYGYQKNTVDGEVTYNGETWLFGEDIYFYSLDHNLLTGSKTQSKGLDSQNLLEANLTAIQSSIATSIKEIIVLTQTIIDTLLAKDVEGVTVSCGSSKEGQLKFNYTEEDDSIDGVMDLYINNYRLVSGKTTSTSKDSSAEHNTVGEYKYDIDKVNVPNVDDFEELN